MGINHNKLMTEIIQGNLSDYSGLNKTKQKSIMEIYIGRKISKHN